MSGGQFDIDSLASWLRYVRGHLGEPGSQPFVFVSSASPDQKIVDRALPFLQDSLRHLTCPLTGEKYRVVQYAHDETGTPFGSSFPEQIASWMWNCRGAILVWSQNFLGSPWCRDIEAPSLIWRWSKQKLPLFTLRLGPTNKKSDFISIDDAEGAPVKVNLSLLADDRNPRNNRALPNPSSGEWLTDLRGTAFEARLCSVSEAIAKQLEERWRTQPVATVLPVGDTPFTPPQPPVFSLAWKGDFSATSAEAWGRTEELERLTEAGRQSTTSLVMVAALGGQGKTTLVRAWIESEVRNGKVRPFEGAFAFSFYHGRTPNEFAEELSAFLRSTAPPFVRQVAGPTRLVEMLGRRRILLFLDGLEEIQKEDPASLGQGAVAQGPVLDLLYGLCEGEAVDSLAVVTSRLRLVGFDEYEERRIAVPIELGGLTPEAGAKLLFDLGVRDATAARREEFSRDLMGHPLALRVFADAVRRRAMNLDFGNAPEMVAEAMGLAEPMEFKDKLSRVVASYCSQFKPHERAIVEAVAVFGGAANIQRVRAYLKQRHGQAWREVESEIAGQLEALVSSGILQYSDTSGEPRYSCHPILREQFRPDESGTRSAVVISIYSRPSPQRPRTLAQAEPYLEAIRIHTDAGAFQDAWAMLSLHLEFGGVLFNFVGGARALLDCLDGFLRADRRVKCEAALGQDRLVGLVLSSASAAVVLDEWQIARDYADWHTALIARKPGIGRHANLHLRADIAAEIGAADDARALYIGAAKVADRSDRGEILLKHAEFERFLGFPRESLRLIREWMVLDQPLEAWILGLRSALTTLAYLYSKWDRALTLRLLAAKRELEKIRSAGDADFEEFLVVEAIPRSERTQEHWQRMYELAQRLERNAELFRSRSLNSWPMGRAVALNGLGRPEEAEKLVWTALHQLHRRSWRRLWYRLEGIRARLLQGQVQLGLHDAWQILGSARQQQYYILARDAAELFVNFGSGTVPHYAEAKQLFETWTQRMKPAAGDIPDLGILPGEEGWEKHITQRLVDGVRSGRRETPATQEDLDAALVAAAELGINGAVVELLQINAGLQPDETEPPAALAAAINIGSIEVLDSLLGAFAEPLDITKAPSQGLIGRAIGRGDVRILERLLRPPAHVSPEQFTALLSAAVAGNASGEIIGFVCDAGADPNALVDGRHPLVRAAAAGNLSALEALGRYIGDINQAVDEDGETALMAAAQEGSEPIIAWLADRGANLDAVDRRGRTAIEYATGNGRMLAIELMAALGAHGFNAEVEKNQDLFRDVSINAARIGSLADMARAIHLGADPKARDSNGQTLLTAAASGGHLDIIRWMRDNRLTIEVDDPDAFGQTALMLAAAGGHDDVLNFLVKEFGASLAAEDNTGGDAIVHALLGNQPGTIQLLESLGATSHHTPASISAIKSAAADGNRDALIAFLKTVATAGWLDQVAESAMP